jgi:organic hydroperoxide reductase OsmC/OhrA
MGREHRYQVSITWTGNLGEGTAGYRSYSRDHEVSGTGKPVLPGSSDPAFRGDPGRWNPEELLVAALSQCHMLWFLNLCADNGIVVISYTDDARGIMAEGDDGGGEFTAVTLRPRAAIADPDQADRALELHEEAHRLCFIARSVNFPVGCEPVMTALRAPNQVHAPSHALPCPATTALDCHPALWAIAPTAAILPGTGAKS